MAKSCTHTLLLKSVTDNQNKLALQGTGGQLLFTANFKVTRHKLDKNKKSGPDKLQVLCPNFKIRGHLPAPITKG